jgi:hypothetical protein
VTYVGWAHGVLFVAFVLVLFQAWAGGALSYGESILALIAALLPFGPFFIDPKSAAIRKKGNDGGFSSIVMTREGIGRVSFLMIVSACIVGQLILNQLFRFQPIERPWLYDTGPILAFAWAGANRARRIGISGVWGLLCGIPFAGLFLCLGFLMIPDSDRR